MTLKKIAALISNTLQRDTRSIIPVSRAELLSIVERIETIEDNLSEAYNENWRLKEKNAELKQQLANMVARMITYSTPLKLLDERI